MKLEIDRQVLEITKQLVVSEIKTAKEDYNREQDFDRKVIIGSTIQNLKQIFSNLELANKPKPIRKIGIGKK